MGVKGPITLGDGWGLERRKAGQARLVEDASLFQKIAACAAPVVRSRPRFTALTTPRTASIRAPDADPMTAVKLTA